MKFLERIKRIRIDIRRSQVKVGWKEEGIKSRWGVERKESNEIKIQGGVSRP
jgi:hypothetical protein